MKKLLLLIVILVIPMIGIARRPFIVELNPVGQPTMTFYCDKFKKELIEVDDGTWFNECCAVQYGERPCENEYVIFTQMVGSEELFNDIAGELNERNIWHEFHLDNGQLNHAWYGIYLHKKDFECEPTIN